MGRRLAGMRVPVTLLLLTGLVLAGVATAATLDRARTFPTPVTALDMTIQAVATATAWSPAHCESVDLWSPDIKGAYPFRAPGPCPRTSTGRGIASVATSYNRVVWLAYAGGNTRDWTLWTATRTAKRPLKLRFASADVDAPAPIVLGNGGEGGIPYAVGADVVELSDAGKRVLGWHAPARVVALAAETVGVAVLLANGHLDLVGPSGKQVEADYDYAPGEVQAFRSVGLKAIVSTKDDIEIRTPTTTTPLGVGPDARLVGFADGNVVYARGSEIRDHKQTSGDDVVLRRAKPPFLAEFDRGGLAWTTGRHVCFSVRAFIASAYPRAAGC
jgi:hypothetical protein